MDATNLQFENESFDAATSFYTLMYMDKETQRKTIEETYRVLKNGPEFHVWDVNLSPDDGKPFFVVPVKIHLPGETLEPSYGSRLNKELSSESVTGMALKQGFTVLEKREIQDSFYLVFQKP